MKIFLGLLIIFNSFFLFGCMTVSHVVPEPPGIENITLQIVKNVSVNIPLPRKLPYYKTKSENEDAYNLYEQDAIFWEYSNYTTVDFNQDGRIDYYVYTTAVFGPKRTDLTLHIEWNKVELTPEERASVEKRNIITLGGIEGRDYAPLSYDFAAQDLYYYLSMEDQKTLLMRSYYRLWEEAVVGGNWDKVDQSIFEKTLIENCKK
ncbi:MAG: hypothetical protein HYW34_00685 [Candidatus Brennerbacteria bacterium]|nr:hypothetical protein [Candidatus Brennerbacteria bacterium]